MHHGLLAPRGRMLGNATRNVKPLFTSRSTLATFLILAVLHTPLEAAGPKTPPGATAGTLFIVGGGKLSDEIRLHFMHLAGGKNARLVIIPTASIKAEQTALIPTYLFFKSQNIKVEVLHTRDRKQADNPEFVKPLTEATGVWLTGGDQSLLSAAYLGTTVEKELRKVLTRGGVIGGTSAGAAVMSSLMIVGGTVEAEVGTGFGLLADVVIDQHFQNRNRLDRLLGVLAKHPECPGVGIDEETALIVRDTTATVEGKGKVWACLPARGTFSASVRPLKSGEELDLAALIRAASARNKPMSYAEPDPAPEPNRATTAP